MGLTASECGVKKSGEGGGGWGLLFGLADFGVALGEFQPNRLREIGIEFHPLHKESEGPPRWEQAILTTGNTAHW